jgi:hypothetical protein
MEVTLMSIINRRLLLTHRPEGMVKREDFDLVRVPIGELNDGEILVRVLYARYSAVHATRLHW